MKKASNIQVLVNELIKQEFAEHADAFESEDKFFEFYAAQQILKEFDLSFDELETGITGSSHDGGCDGIYLFINGDLISEDSDSDKYKKDIKMSFFIIQAKNTNSFSEDPINRWKSLCLNLLDFEKSFDEFTKRYSQDVLSAFKLFKDTYIKLLRRRPKINIEFDYVAKGTEIHPNTQQQADELKNIVTTFFPGPNISVEFNFVGAQRLFELNEVYTTNQFTIDLSDHPINPTSQHYIALVKLSDYFKFITNSDGDIIKHIFESNVRDYQGTVSVNKDIQGTLKRVSVEDFWWLNNGVTIVASEANAVQKKLNVTSPEIVNGLQTSTEIYNYFSQNPDKLETDKRNLLIRVIVPDSEESRDKIILSTNSQTNIPKSSLRATDPIHRQIELYLKARNFYYDRRKNYYKNQGKSPRTIISIPFLAQVLISTLLQKPNYARARPSTLIIDDDTYKSLFSEDFDLDCYYVSASLGKLIETTLKKDCSYEKSIINDILFYVIYVVAAREVLSTTINQQNVCRIDMASINKDKILDAAEFVFKNYSRLGGNGKVAKGANLITSLKDVLNIEFEKSKLQQKN